MVVYVYVRARVFVYESICVSDACDILFFIICSCAYTFMFIHMCACVCLCMCHCWLGTLVCRWLSLCMSAYAFARDVYFVYVSRCVRVSVNVRICVCKCLYVCMVVRLQVCVCSSVNETIFRCCTRTVQIRMC